MKACVTECLRNPSHRAVFGRWPSALLALALSAAAIPAQVLTGVTDVEKVATLAGKDSMNNTAERWNVAGTDLGHMFDMDGRLYMVFGDTWGRGFVPPPGSGGGPAWRTNVMAVIRDRDPRDGLTFESMITDANGDAKELIPPDRNMGDVTVIPTYGVAVGRSMFLHYMAVNRWQGPGKWTIRHAGLARSDDRGQTWSRLPWLWPSDSNFAQVAIVKSGGFLYFFGVPAGRFGGVKLARVSPSDISQRSAYRYFTGVRDGRPQWAPEETQGAVVASAPVGELSVMWNKFLGRWIMTTLDETKREIVLREAPDLWGPWSAPTTLASGKDYPGLYAPYMHPWLTERNGEIIYFTMSEWNPYSVYLMRARLLRRPATLDASTSPQ